MEVEHKHADGHSHGVTRRNFVYEEGGSAAEVDIKKRKVYHNSV